MNKTFKADAMKEKVSMPAVKPGGMMAGSTSLNSELKPEPTVAERLYKTLTSFKGKGK